MTTMKSASSANAVAASMRVEPTSGPLGADVVGVDFGLKLTDKEVRLIEKAWHDHLVLRFRGQALTDEQLMAFSAYLGTLDPAPLGSANPTERDQTGFVTIISNVVVDGRSIGALGSYESLWHSDMSYNERPPIGSLLHALEVPPAGGDTGFANMYLAYEKLPPALKEQADRLTCIHDASRNSAGELRKGYQEVTDLRATPGAVHPLVITHPATQRRALYLGRRKNAYIPGLEIATSEALLDKLWAHATRSEFTWYQKWRLGDLVMWDNRCTLHRRDAFDAASRRLMHRTQITGAAIA